MAERRWLSATFSEEDCTNQRGLKPGVHTASDSPISGLLCTKLVYVQYSCALKRGEHGDRYRTNCRARRSTLPEQAWERARRRAEIIGPLAQSETVVHEAADAAARYWVCPGGRSTS